MALYFLFNFYGISLAPKSPGIGKAEQENLLPGGDRAGEGPHQPGQVPAAGTAPRCHHKLSAPSSGRQ